MRNIGWKTQKVVAALADLGVEVKGNKVRKKDVEAIFNSQLNKTLNTRITLATDGSLLSKEKFEQLASELERARAALEQVRDDLKNESASDAGEHESWKKEKLVSLNSKLRSLLIELDDLQDGIGEQRY